MTLHAALFRFGLGPRLGEAPSPSGAQAAVLAQLSRSTTLPAAADLPSAAEGVAQLMATRSQISTARRNQEAVRFSGPSRTSLRELAHRVELARTSETPLHERLALHWTNHFALTRAGTSGYFAGAMEREAIRPHMLGHFHAMLRGCTTHPAMLFFLNNVSSYGPNSADGQRRQRGLNENLGRELLELHTLGVDGGYTQADVLEVARILTGWTVHVESGAREQRIGFDPAMHEPGARTVLGKRYPEGGAAQLEALLADLARHPATARHVTRRLVRHFIGDTAPPALAQGLAALFLRTDGDLGAVTRALLEHPASWSTPRLKARPPVELVFSAARMLDAPSRPAPRRSMLAMGQAWQDAPSPAGWPEADDAWVAPDSVKTRLDWALQLAAALDPLPDARPLAERAFGDALSPQTRQAIQRAEGGRQAMTLLLMSPEFQRR
jgi:uncharacterized protein (DUF1800 family)